MNDERALTIGDPDQAGDKRFLEFGLPLPDFTIDPLLLDPGDERNIGARNRHGGKRYFIDATGRRRRPMGCAACLIPNEPGCYVWYSSEHFEVGYVGKARFLRNRLQDYWTRRDLRLVEWFYEAGDRFEVTLVSVWLCSDRDRFERVLIDRLQPLLNVQH